MSLTHSDIPRIHKALRDATHDLCVVLVLNQDAYAYAVAEGATGKILSWDGWYYDHEEVPKDTTALADLDWTDWDDMPTKLLIRSQGQWANGRMASWLIPTFSPAQKAAELVAMHADTLTTTDAVKTMAGSRVVAYLPIADSEVYETTLAARNSRATSLTD